MNTQFEAVDRLGAIMGDAINRNLVRLICASGVDCHTVDVDRLVDSGRAAWAELESSVWAGWEVAAHAVVSEAALQQFVAAQAHAVAQRGVEIYAAQ